MNLMKDKNKTIMDAVNALQGELENTYSYSHEDFLYRYLQDGDYVCASFDKNETMRHEYICTTEEFNNLISELETNFGESITYSDYNDVIASLDWFGAGLHFDYVLFNIKPSIGSDLYYCNKVDELVFHTERQLIHLKGKDKGGWRIIKKPKLTTPKAIYTLDMKERGGMVEAGMLFATNAGEYTAEYTNKKSVCFADEDGFLVTVTRGHAKPIDTRTEKEKAIDAMVKKSTVYCNVNVMRACLSFAYDEWVGE